MDYFRRSILGPLFFNNFLCDLFFITNGTYFESYADDNTTYAMGKDIEDAVGNNIEDIVINLQSALLALFPWFYDNQL